MNHQLATQAVAPRPQSDESQGPWYLLQQRWRRIDHEIDALDRCWIERPHFDFEFESYEAYLNRTQA